MWNVVGSQSVGATAAEPFTVAVTYHPSSPVKIKVLTKLDRTCPRQPNDYAPDSRSWLRGLRLQAKQGNGSEEVAKHHGEVPGNVGKAS